MVRTVFFSFHFDRDHWRAGQVRNSWVTEDSQEAAGYVDGGTWEEVKRDGDDAIRSWIRRQMKGCSVAAVLIGSETYGRQWIDYEIKKAVRDDMGLVGIRVHNMKDKHGRTDSRGKNPLKKWEVDGTNLTDIYNTYDWKYNNGRQNLSSWIEEAAKIANR